MRKLIAFALLSISLTAQADSLTGRLLQASAEQAKDMAIEKTAGAAFDTVKSTAEKALYAETITGTVVRVLDGDTIDVKTDKEVVRIRFDSIDAPEKAQPFGQVAKKTLTDWIANQPVTVNITTKDRYGRMIGVVMLEKANVNRAMVERGLAFANTQYLNDKTIQAIENNAKAKKAGVWQIPESQIVKPWDYRHNQKDAS